MLGAEPSGQYPEKCLAAKDSTCAPSSVLETWGRQEAIWGALLCVRVGDSPDLHEGPLAAFEHHLSQERHLVSART